MQICYVTVTHYFLSRNIQKRHRISQSCEKLQELQVSIGKKCFHTFCLQVVELLN